MLLWAKEKLFMAENQITSPTKKSMKTIHRDAQINEAWEMLSKKQFNVIDVVQGLAMFEEYQSLTEEDYILKLRYDGLNANFDYDKCIENLFKNAF